MGALLMDGPMIVGNEMCRLSGRHGEVFYCSITCCQHDRRRGLCAPQSAARKAPPSVVRLMRILGAITVGILVAFLLFRGFGGGGSGWGGGGGRAMGFGWVFRSLFVSVIAGSQL